MWWWWASRTLLWWAWYTANFTACNTATLHAATVHSLPWREKLMVAYYTSGTMSLLIWTTTTHTVWRTYHCNQRMYVTHHMTDKDVKWYHTTDKLSFAQQGLVQHGWKLWMRLLPLGLWGGEEAALCGEEAAELGGEEAAILRGDEAVLRGEEAVLCGEEAAVLCGEPGALPTSLPVKTHLCKLSLPYIEIWFLVMFFSLFTTHIQSV